MGIAQELVQRGESLCRRRSSVDRSWTLEVLWCDRRGLLVSFLNLPRFLGWFAWLNNSFFSSEILQIQRLRARNNLSLSEAQARLGAQHPLSSKLDYADFVIDNSGPLPDLQAQVDRVIAKLDGRAGWSWVLSWLIPPVGIARALLRISWRLYFAGVGKPKKMRTRGERGGGSVEEIEMRDRRR